MPVLTPELLEKWKYLHRFLSVPGPYTDPDAELGEEVINKLSSLKVLVIGAGGLGCEILKNLALSGFTDIHVIDMDTIDVSNLNRQFLFRQADVGEAKATIAARFVSSRVQGCKITPHVCRIQDKDDAFYLQFSLIICGLDSIEARRWINSLLIDLVDDEDPDSLIPLVDGGTEGFKGQSKVILPTITSCIECQLDLHAPREAVPLCTLATIPRQPQHCIEWAQLIAWENERPNDTLDKDDPEHITWLFQKASARATEFNIPGVTYSMTQGVIKNIIPAIASTNAIIAASCCNEALKLITSINPCLGIPETENYMMYAGDESIYTHTFEHLRKPDCPVCGNLAKKLEVNGEDTLEELIESFRIRPESQLKKPSVRSESKSLYYQAPPSLEEQTRPNLKRKLTELLIDGEEIAVSDPAFSINFRYKVVFS